MGGRRSIAELAIGVPSPCPSSAIRFLSHAVVAAPRNVPHSCQCVHLRRRVMVCRQAIATLAILIESPLERSPSKSSHLPPMESSRSRGGCPRERVATPTDDRSLLGDRRRLDRRRGPSQTSQRRTRIQVWFPSLRSPRPWGGLRGRHGPIKDGNRRWGYAMSRTSASAAGMDLLK